MLSTETNQCGLTGQMPSSTKPHLFVFGGHSGKGMVTATEIAASGRTCAITTISKRGKPNAPGPASAFAQAPKVRKEVNDICKKNIYIEYTLIHIDIH